LVKILELSAKTNRVLRRRTRRVRLLLEMPQKIALVSLLLLESLDELAILTSHHLSVSVFLLGTLGRRIRLGRHQLK
jgi:hypothetical protein